MFKMGGSPSKWRGLFEMAGSRSKRRARIRDDGLAFEKTNSHSKWRGCVRNSGLTFETTGCVRNNGGVCSKRWAPWVAASTSKEGVGCEQAFPGQI